MGKLSFVVEVDSKRYSTRLEGIIRNALKKEGVAVDKVALVFAGIEEIEDCLKKDEIAIAKIETASKG